MEKDITYEGGMPALVIDLGNLQYCVLQQFLIDLSLKIRLNGTSDRTKGSPVMSENLEKAADKLLESAAAMEVAWMMCEQHMTLDGRNLQPWTDHDEVGQEREGYIEGQLHCREGWCNDWCGCDETAFSRGYSRGWDEAKKAGLHGTKTKQRTKVR